MVETGQETEQAWACFSVLFNREITKCFESVNFFPKHAIIIGDYVQEKDRGMKAVATPELEIERAE